MLFNTRYIYIYKNIDNYDNNNSNKFLEFFEIINKKLDDNDKKLKKMNLLLEKLEKYIINSNKKKEIYEENIINEYQNIIIDCKNEEYENIILDNM